MFNQSDYNSIKHTSQEYYETLTSIFCPALKSDIHFSSHGFNHLIYKKDRSERDRGSQIMRFKLISRAFELIKITTTIQEYEESYKDITIKKNKKKTKATKLVIYWGIIAIIRDRKIKVILRKIGNGNIHFWSVIPSWVTNKTRDGKYIKTMKGDPDND